MAAGAAADWMDQISSDPVGAKRKLWRDRDLVSPVTAVTGVYNPFGAGFEGGMHIN